MGKKMIEKGEGKEVQCIEDQKSDNQQTEKKPLHKFLPYHKYVDAKTKIYKKRLSQAIKGITLNKYQIKKAVECLSKYATEHNDPTDLTQKQDYVYVCIDVSKIPQQHSVRPIQIRLPFPIYSKQAKSRYTVITSDQIEDKFVETVDSMNAPMLQQVLSYNKIKKDYKSLKDKRELLAANDLFFCDWKVYNLLRQPLGKLFYQQKKYPFPIDCDGQVPSHLNQQYPNYESYINGLADYTYTMMGNGPVYTIKICTTKMPVRQQVKNIMHGSYSLIANLLDTKLQPEHIRQISIKTYNSPSLPIYNYLSKQQIQCYKK